MLQEGLGMKSKFIHITLGTLVMLSGCGSAPKAPVADEGNIQKQECSAFLRNYIGEKTAAILCKPET